MCILNKDSCVLKVSFESFKNTLPVVYSVKLQTIPSTPYNNTIGFHKTVIFNSSIIKVYIDDDVIRDPRNVRYHTENMALNNNIL